MDNENVWRAGKEFSFFHLDFFLTTRTFAFNCLAFDFIFDRLFNRSDVFDSKW